MRAQGVLRLPGLRPIRIADGIRLPPPDVGLLRGLRPVFAPLNCGEYVQHAKISSFSHSFLDKNKITFVDLTVPYFMELFFDNCLLSIYQHQLNREKCCRIQIATSRVTRAKAYL
jgi:hypothetical protein